MPRHKLTKSNATGIGEKISTSQKVKPGKQNIWDPTVSYEADLLKHSGRRRSSATTSCFIEDFRMTQCNFLRKQLRKFRIQHRGIAGCEKAPTDTDDAKLSSISKLKPAPMALERWFMRDQLKQQLQKSKPKRFQRDPVIPMLDPTELENLNSGNFKFIDSGLVSDLMTASDSLEVAQKVAYDITLLSHTTALKIQEKASSAAAAAVVIVVKHRHSYDITLQSSKANLLKINPAHYEKLRQMYNGKTDDFHQALYCLLARYHAIQGHGFQAAVPEQAFDVLQTYFGVNFECFASPLNCRYKSFCSAFTDTDSTFGSYGSFFSFYPASGSFEVNPPFEPTLMDKMAVHLKQLLLNSGGSSKPLSFIVVVPGWKECKAWGILKKAARHCEIIAKDDHGFCDGASHQRQDRYRQSPYDTAFFILQNPPAAAKWPITSEALAAIRRGMAEGKPTPAMVRRQERSGKGTTDVCRGVYKGKKRNATGEGVMSRKAQEKKQKRKKKYD